VGPQHQKDVARNAARDLTGIVGELAALKGDAAQLLTGPKYEALRLRLEIAHAAAEAAAVETRFCRPPVLCRATFLCKSRGQPYGAVHKKRIIPHGGQAPFVGIGL
jgi:hypothetical protein